MSAELMSSTFVRRPSVVHGAIISEPNARISFKFRLLLPLGHARNAGNAGGYAVKFF